MYSNRITAQFIRDILIEEMGIDPSTIWIRDQNAKFPNVSGMFIELGMTIGRTISNVSYMKTVTSGNPPEDSQVEFNEVQRQEFIQIDIVSKDNTADQRNWEIIAAMQSFFSQQSQEANNFKIFRIPQSCVNTSGAEGGSQLNRYSVTVLCFVGYRKQKTLTTDQGDYYDDFHQRVDDSATIGTDAPLIEFEINTGGIVP